MSPFARMVVLIAGLLLGAGCASQDWGWEDWHIAYSNNNAGGPASGTMMDERTGGYMQPVYSQWP